MRLLTTFPIVTIITVALGLNGLSAETWTRGSAVALDASGEVEISVPTEGAVYKSFEQPQYFPGIFSCRAQARSSVLMQTSNEMALAFRGEGFFAVERFEGLFAVGETGDDEWEEAQSRMILNLRRGELMIDSRRLPGKSKLVVETPFGRITGGKIVLLVQIEFDYRSGIYVFAISSAEGSVRFSDLRQESYSIYPGQRISGAGSYQTPAIEVGGQTEEIREKFELFFATLEDLDSERVDPLKLQAHLQAIPNSGTTVLPSVPSNKKSGKAGEKRPRVIEFAPMAEPVSPFRGEIKPLSGEREQEEFF